MPSLKATIGMLTISALSMYSMAEEKAKVAEVKEEIIPPVKKDGYGYEKEHGHANYGWFGCKWFNPKKHGYGDKHEHGYGHGYGHDHERSEYPPFQKRSGEYVAPEPKYEGVEYNPYADTYGKYKGSEVGDKYQKHNYERGYENQYYEPRMGDKHHDKRCHGNSYKCVGFNKSKYLQCDHGRYIVRNCGPGTVCRQNGKHSIYCGYPSYFY
ncbi:hypothetical protein AX774_g4710 [Zancudomyces culisetae]|uniref:Carbohydrate-binding module family 19 domain-containing protein n=1 Tax=Zancudomyces culisetae TaxID=1213189 RepID=A0A1R1PLS2_ZANCU|nr:hypothetical protein AX774_g7741 [Zancudomyces culisetae]OMH81175.1 hypothetical protein AX774_g5372 [Zancudomyces culisetae]OMH81822.1 hypothetical protein AX774_g4710 [Zancudomyces culisetae]|eukprot:OMH78861.1 hypothetical protein AX774_g7741 [Zancudomyces culisetae]